MLNFDRPAFKAGIMLLEYNDGADEQILVLRPTDLGQQIDVGGPAAEANVKQKFPAWLLEDADFAARRNAHAQAKANSQSPIF